MGCLSGLRNAAAAFHSLSTIAATVATVAATSPEATATSAAAADASKLLPARADSVLPELPHSTCTCRPLLSGQPRLTSVRRDLEFCTSRTGIFDVLRGRRRVRHEPTTQQLRPGPGGLGHLSGPDHGCAAEVPSTPSSALDRASVPSFSAPTASTASVPAFAAVPISVPACAAAATCAAATTSALALVSATSAI